MAKKDMTGVSTTSSKSSTRTRNLIYAGAFAAIYIVLFVAAAMGTAAVPVLYLFAGVPVGLIATTVFILAILKSKSIVPVIVMGVGYLVMTGMVYWQTGVMEVIVTCITCLILKFGNMDRRLTYDVAGAVFNLNMAAPYIAILLARDAYLATVANYSGAEQAAAIDAAAFDGVFFVICIACLVAGAVGSLIANKLIDKHFASAGVV